MAVEATHCLKDTRLAGTDLRTKQFHFVKLNTDGTVGIITALTDRPYGIVQNNPNTGEAAELVLIGVSKAIADGVVTAGDSIGPSADGQVDTKTGLGTATTDWSCGIARSTSGAAAEVMSVVVCCPAAVPSAG